jgi:hypothetical protein
MTLKKSKSLQLIVITIGFIFSGPLLSAQDNNSLDIQNTDIRSSRSSYLGGVDEEDIEVNKDQVAPYRVINIKAVQNKVKNNLLKEVSEAESEADSEDSATE